ncbi:MAG: zinc ribbon domain-containing protein [Oscillospiraceae bacterium]|nr:zinc ribbon domain-containing protein [Oscillospiraceae bacterium]
MAFFDNLGKKLSEAGQNVSQQTRNMGDISRLNNLISEDRKLVSQHCCELGKAYYQAHRGDPGSEFASQVAEIGKLVAEIAEAEDSIRRLKGIVKCPGCGAELPIQSLFCPQCGRQLPPPPAPAPKEDVCPTCGKPAPKGTVFCCYCGTRLDG